MDERSACDSEMGRLLAEHVADQCIYMVDMQGHVTAWNPGARRLFGYAEREIVGRGAECFSTPEDIRAGLPDEEVRLALARQRTESQRWQLRKDSSRFWADLITVALVDSCGKPRGVARIVRDRTDAQQQLADHQERLRIALEAGRMGTWEWNIQTGDIVWTDNLLALHGFRSDTFEGTLEAFQRLIHPDDRETVQRAIANSIEKGSSYDAEFRILWPDGSIHWMAGKGRAFYNEQGAPLRMVGIGMDITARRQAADALEQSEARFRGLMEQAPFSIQVLSPDGRTLQVNKAWEDLWNATIDDLAGYNMLQDAQLQASGTLARLRQAFAGQAVTLPIIEYDPNETIPDENRPGDRRRWVSAVAYPIKDHHQAVRQVILVHQDITAQKLAEDALRRSEERFRGIVSHSIAGVVEVDLTGRFLFANEQYCKIVGRSLEELRGLRMQDISHPDDLAQNIPLFEKMVRDGTPYIIEKRYLQPDGSQVWVNNSVSGLRGPDGQVRSIVAVCVDVTARRYAEEAHREGERRLRTLIDNLPDGAIYRVEQDRETGAIRFTFISAGVENFFGIPAEAAVADSSLLYAAIHPDDRERVLAVEAESLRTFEQFDVEFRVLHRSGELRWLHCRAAPHRRTEGEVVWEGLMLDVTARKLAEQSLLDADRRKDEFLAMLGHELRNPLAPIRTGLEILSLEQDSEVVRLMTRQVDHLVRLVDDLLDVSRIMRGKIGLRREPVELARIIAQAIEIARPVIDGQHHQLTRSLPAEDVWLDGDPVRLAQVFGNLLNNAAKYTPPHGQIWVSAETDEDATVVRIRDNGMGIEPLLLPHVFDLFTQGDRAIDRSQGGLGIGLTVVRSLVEMHAGTVAAHSEGAGRGCEFVVRLPMLEAQDRLQAISGVARMEHGYRVLIVDDNVAAATVLQLLLRRLGPNDVTVAHDGPSTLAAVAKNRPDMLLLDIGLPGMSGLEVARQLRANPDNANILLVALTGYGTTDDRQLAEAVGFDTHLIKPADMTILQRLFDHPKLAAGSK